VPCGPVLGIDETAQSPQLREVGIIREATDPVLGSMLVPRFPLKFSDADAGFDVEAPHLGEHNAALLADLVADELRPVVDAFLGRHGLRVGDVERWVAHPGGPKVLTALEQALDITPTDTAVTWSSLRDVGNLSSASVLHVLEQTLAASPPGGGAPAVMVAMGPGFCAELVLIEW